MAAQIKSEIGISVRIDPQEVRREFKVRKQESERHQRAYKQEARQLYDLRAGHQITEEQKLELRNRYGGAYPEIEFNVTDKYCGAVEGLQINNRQEVRFYPREEGDAGIDEMATGVVKWCRDQSEAEDEETDAFGDVFLTGVGCVEHFLEDEQDPTSQFIAQERRDPIEMGWDPMARKKNLTDRRYQYRLKPFTRDEFIEKFGEEPDGGYDPPDSPITQHVIRPEDYDDAGYGSEMPAPIYVADYQFMRLQTLWKVTASMIDPQTGEAQVMTQLVSNADWRVMKPALIAAGVKERDDESLPSEQWYEAERVSKRCYYRAWLCGDRVLNDKVYELKCGWTYEFITGKRDRNSNLWYGIGRVIVSPQMWLNKFFSTILYTLMVNAKGGIMAEEDAFEDQAEAERSWANPASITFLTPGALRDGKIQPKPQAPYPQGMDRLMEFTLAILPQSTGLNPELLGLADRQQAGILEAQRKQAAMAIIAWVFDSMRRYYKRSGKLMLAMIRQYLPDNQLIRIIGEKGAKYVPLIKDQMVASYDVIPEEAPTSVNAQERAWVALREAAPIAASMGAPPPPSAIKLIPGLPEDFKQEWLKSIENPEKQQAAQAAQDLQKKAAQAKIAKDETQAQLNAAKAQQTQLEAGMTAQLQPISQALDNMAKAQQMRQQQTDAYAQGQQPGAITFDVPQAQPVEPTQMLN